MSEISWGENNGRLQPSADKDTYFAGTLPSPSTPEISMEDIKLLSEIFRDRQGLLWPILTTQNLKFIHERKYETTNPPRLGFRNPRNSEEGKRVLGESPIHATAFDALDRAEAASGDQSQTSRFGTGIRPRKPKIARGQGYEFHMDMRGT